MNDAFGDNFKEIPLDTSKPPTPSGSMYPEELTTPMRAELSSRGVTELFTAEDAAQLDAAKGTAVVLVNSVCGCAAGAARPGLLMAKETSAAQPDKWLTAFAGVHKEAVDAVRERVPAPPSSPNIILFKDGKPVAMMHRSDIEVRDGQGVASAVSAMLNEFCAS